MSRIIRIILSISGLFFLASPHIEVLYMGYGYNFLNVIFEYFVNTIFGILFLTIAYMIGEINESNG